MFKKHHSRWLLCACKWFNQHVTRSFFLNCFYSCSHKNTFLFLSQSTLICLDWMFDRLLWFCHNSTEFLKKCTKSYSLQVNLLSCMSKPPWCLQTIYWPRGGGPQKAENAPSWQWCSKEDEKSKHGKCSLDFRISPLIQPYKVSTICQTQLLSFPSHRSHCIAIL